MQFPYMYCLVLAIIGHSGFLLPLLGDLALSLLSWSAPIWGSIGSTAISFV
jgi:hypothetical protein